jgi:hypothetical protein
MPRSQNRRTIEVPVTLYEELKARAQHEGTTIPAVLHGLIVDGESMQEWFGQIDSQLYSLRREVRELREQLVPVIEESSRTHQRSI